MRIDICIPVFNDWTAAKLLLARLDQANLELDDILTVWFVDDGSSEPIPEEIPPLNKIDSVHVLRLRRNIGHQRAIAVGLTFLYVRDASDAVLVMDGDGEDNPDHVPQLITRLREQGCTKAIFAKRSRRTEGAAFRIGYLAYKVIHRLMTGQKIEVGNFSIVPRSVLSRLVGVSELWNHFAASAYYARLPIETIPLPRATRLAGSSKMNFVSLVTHGLSAISVYSEKVGVRALCLAGLMLFASLLGIGAVLVLKFATGLAIPGWATMAAGIGTLLLTNTLILSVGVALFILHARSRATMVPLKDYESFILDSRQFAVRTAP